MSRRTKRVGCAVCNVKLLSQQVSHHHGSELKYKNRLTFLAWKFYSKHYRN